MGHRLALDKAVYDYEVFKGSGVDAGADLCRAMRRLGDEMACSCREDTTRLLTDEESDRGRDPFAWEVDYDDRWNAVSEDKRQKALSYLKSRDAKNRKNNG